LQVFSEAGFVGLFLFLAAIGYMLKQVFYAYLDEFNRKEVVALFSSFLCIGLVAFGSFPWQIAPIIYLTIIVVGLLHNQNILQGEMK
jgi:O-antigen ligase